ncbi:MAG: patatin-like phospholipase family protein [Gammaproteobacteria bacterium]
MRHVVRDGATAKSGKAIRFAYGDSEPISRPKISIPFRAVATDIVTGKEVVLGSGSLAQAVFASMSVPAAFASTEIDNRLLVDGGMANNMPVSVVRDIGADVIITVHISTPLLNGEGMQPVLAAEGSNEAVYVLLGRAF